jgi:hypothetical protein
VRSDSDVHSAVDSGISCSRADITGVYLFFCSVCLGVESVLIGLNCIVSETLLKLCYHQTVRNIVTPSCVCVSEYSNSNSAPSISHTARHGVGGRSYLGFSGIAEGRLYLRLLKYINLFICHTIEMPIDQKKRNEVMT